MDYDIALYLENLITESQSVDIAISEFKRNMADDDGLKEAYREWCEAQGYSERTGYKEYIEEFIENRNERWNSLNEYDDEQ